MPRWRRCWPGWKTLRPKPPVRCPRCAGGCGVNLDPWFARLVLAPRLSRLLERHPAPVGRTRGARHAGRTDRRGLRRRGAIWRAGAIALLARKLLETRILTCAAPALSRTPRHPATSERAGAARVPDVSRSGHRTAVRLGIPPRDEVVSIKARGSPGGQRPGDDAGGVCRRNGIAQTFELGLAPMIASGALVQVLPDWAMSGFRSTPTTRPAICAGQGAGIPGFC